MFSVDMIASDKDANQVRALHMESDIADIRVPAPVRFSRQAESQEVVWWARSTTQQRPIAVDGGSSSHTSFTQGQQLHRVHPDFREHQGPWGEDRLARSLPVSPVEPNFLSSTKPPFYPNGSLSIAHASNPDILGHASGDLPIGSYSPPRQTNSSHRRLRAFSEPFASRLLTSEFDPFYREALAGSELTIMPSNHHVSSDSTPTSTPSPSRVIHSNTLSEESGSDSLFPLRSESRLSMQSEISTLATFTHPGLAVLDRPFANYFGVEHSPGKTSAGMDPRSAWTGEWNRDLQDVIRELRSLR